jgi:fibronectin type 3 domain-containing protein
LGLVLILFLSFGSSVLFDTNAFGAQADLAWNASTDPTTTGYKVYYGNQSGKYSTSVDAGNKTTFTVTNLQVGPSYYFAVTAYNSAGQQSVFSNEVMYNACTYSISPTSQTFGSAGGTGTVSVTTQTGCGWTSASGASWMTITSGSSGTGNGTVNYSIAADTGASRSAASTIAGKAFTVSQTSQTSTYVITASAGGGGSISPSGSVSVNAGASQFFTIAASTGHRISNVTVDGASVGAVASYTFNNVSANHTIAASFSYKRRW